ncbi:MAG: ABC transporter permease [Cyclobacteriaceae bacterium]|nr:ABC transporter permease [Cyclobacteriaceae bacterium]
MNKDNNIPQSILGIVRWFCPEQLLEGIEGDLVEQYQDDLAQGSRSRARRRLIWSIIRLFHPEILLRNKFKTSIIQTMMVRNYIKVSLRNIQKRKLYSLINTIGLAIGMAFCLLIFLFVEDEKSFDKMHENKDRIYRVEIRAFDYWNKAVPEKERYNTHAYTQLALQPVLKEESVVVEFASRYSSNFKGAVRNEDKVFTEDLTFVDKDFFHMFSFPLLAGGLNKIFSTKEEVVLTPVIARKYFGDQDPLGKTLLIDAEGTGEKAFVVSGIIKEPPANSSLEFSILLPVVNRPYYERQINRWANFNVATLVQLKRGGSTTAFRDNLEKITKTHMAEELARWRKDAGVSDSVDVFSYGFSPLMDWHMRKGVEWHKVSDPQYSYILGGIAILILVIACINYISLALTSSSARSTEVGVRKVMGAVREQLVWQFSFESLMLAFVALIAAVGLVVLALPYFNEFTDKAIHITSSKWMTLLVSGFLLTCVVGLLAGSYPSLLLSGYKPVSVLRNRYGTKMSAGFAKPLVVLQFALSAFLIVSSIVMFRQMRFITSKDLGYNKDQVVVVPTQAGWSNASDRVVQQFRNHLSQESNILSIAGTSTSFNQGWSLNGYKIDGQKRSAYVYAVDPYYVPLLGLELVDGRNFDPAIASDSSAILVNEALVEDMGWENPLEERLPYVENLEGPGSKVIGVLKDYHYRSLETEIAPMFLAMDKEYIGHLTTMLVKVASGNIPTALETMRGAWKELYPDKPFDFTFLDEDVAKQYQAQQRWMKIMSLSTAFAIIVSCLGLFGLAGINAVNRTKEVGIRKVMGAELSNIFVLLNKQFVWLSIIAFALAIPFSWYVMNKWLSGFEYRIEMDWMLFVVSTAMGTAIALVTVSYHALKAASTNPAETLKYE